MADITKTKNVLSILTSFTDGDTRTITLDNPKPSIAAADIASLNTFLSNNSVIIGDKTGAPFAAITEARVVSTISKHLDLT